MPEHFNNIDNFTDSNRLKLHYVTREVLISWRIIVRSFGMKIQLMGHYMIDMVFYLVASKSPSSSAMLYAGMLWHWLNRHDPSALEQASLYFFATALKCEACTVVHWQMMVFIWFCDHCHHYVTMFFLFIKRQPQSVSGIHYFLITSFLIDVTTWANDIS